MDTTYGILGSYEDDGSGRRWVGPIENELSACKLIMGYRILDCFDKELNRTGTYTTLEGWVVDARRQDLDNLKNLYEYLTKMNASSATVRIHDNSMVNMTLARLADLCTELQGVGLTLYQKKWQKLTELDTASTIEAVNSVVW